MPSEASYGMGLGAAWECFVFRWIGEGPVLGGQPRLTPIGYDEKWMVRRAMKQDRATT
ncbi:hypothetical protein LOC71_01845 [Rhodopirellula sp. JC740]|uniref:Uncharacterized protein n=1 Tax=Rhodopirellula halodulae TaxID=2894198 RepID=A0ABS8NBW1_9BACT|nr:hypothetical protein [Rhodopirellula sp. JC740]MCC9640998.1 hypothetical protein [Rhodopirellula sp. JC740]